MPIASSDIQYRLSGGATNTVPDSSLGGVKSSTAIVNNITNNLFDDVTLGEHGAGQVVYRCIYVHNNHGTLTLTNGLVWIPSNTTGIDSDISLGVGTSAVGGTEQTIANETTTPTGITWSNTCTTRSSGLALGNIVSGSHRAVWIRRTVVVGTTPQIGDTCQIEAGGDT